MEERYVFADASTWIPIGTLMLWWRTGAPIDVTPTKDDLKLAADPSRNNDFRYDFPNDSQTQDRCPFAAHTRKTNPRADLEDLGISNEIRRIIRRGIQFGPEVTRVEAQSGKTIRARGLLFAAYSSNIINGFQFIQQSKFTRDADSDGGLLIPLRLGEQSRFSNQEARHARV